MLGSADQHRMAHKMDSMFVCFSVCFWISFLFFWCMCVYFFPPNRVRENMKLGGEEDTEDPEDWKAYDQNILCEK